MDNAAKKLQVEENALISESISSKKTQDALIGHKKCMVHNRILVVWVTAFTMVVKTDMNSGLGKISELFNWFNWTSG